MADTESCALYLPALEDLAGVLECGLKSNYAEVLVKVVDCPDLTLEPFGFPVKGLCGKSRIVDVGGVPYLVPTARLDKIYNMNTVAKKIDLPGAYLLGAGASSPNSVGMNAEMIFSIKAESATSPAVNGNYMASVNLTDNGCLLEKYKEKYSDHDFGLLSNLYASEGKPGKVIEVKVKRRTGKDNFVSCMRKSLKAQYGDKPVGMGGSFIIQEGKAKLHIMPREFSACPLNTDEDVDRWLNFYDMKAPLICQSVFVSHDPESLLFSSLLSYNGHDHSNALWALLVTKAALGTSLIFIDRNGVPDPMRDAWLPWHLWCSDCTSDNLYPI